MEHDGFFYDEMMSHPALFTHPGPAKVAIIGHSLGILAETVKHDRVQTVSYISPEPGKHVDKRIEYHPVDISTWLTKCPHKSYDVIINTQPEGDFLLLNQILKSDGILIQPCPVSLLDPTQLLPLSRRLRESGFLAWQTLNFAQPSYPSGWRLLMMASKQATFRPLREKEVFNRTFITRYYNYDIHKAALALPEFANYLFHADKI